MSWKSSSDKNIYLLEKQLEYLKIIHNDINKLIDIINTKHTFNNESTTDRSIASDRHVHVCEGGSTTSESTM